MMFQINRLVLVILVITMGSSVCFGEQHAVTETKNKLKQLDTQINQLKQTLSHSKDKQGVLNQELTITEKAMAVCVQKIKKIAPEIQVKQQNIVTLERRISVLNVQLTQQKNILSQHVKARYKMGEYRPMIIALNQNNPDKVNQLLTYYQYVMHSRAHCIDDIVVTQHQLTTQEQTLQSEIEAQKTLQQALQREQQDLEHRKRYHQVVIQSLNETIKNQQNTLSGFEENKRNLSRLLETLAQESAVRQVTQPKQPFAMMRHKLPLPVHVNRQSIQSMNQGVTFFAAEGTAVQAVFPGRVVFSDWLNGYGLLLIIDHGQGFMTLYAQNQALFKSKGSQVAQGEEIASIGHSGGLKQNALYFEVRQRGKATPPLAWLVTV